MEAFNMLSGLATQFLPPSPSFIEANIPNGSQKGKVFVVTGGNSELGYGLCKILITSGATVYMATRSKVRKSSRGYQVDYRLGPRHPRKRPAQFSHLDLADLALVRTAANEFAQKENELDILWNNGRIGANAVKYGERTKQDLEILMGIHCVGALLFSELLVPQLKAAAVQGAPSRVVWLATVLVDTSAPKNGTEFPAVETGYEARMNNYAAPKAGVWMLTGEFAKRHREE
ncbi:hypothetical protein LQW54_013394 [Pestalotiopsis sp. IQ-011]